MIKTQLKVETKKVETIIDIICNNCGKSCYSYDKDDEEHRANYQNYYGLIERTIETGYWSKHLPDGTRYTFSLCEKCLKKMFEKFKIPPKEEGYI